VIQGGGKAGHSVLGSGNNRVHASNIQETGRKVNTISNLLAKVVGAVRFELTTF